MNIMKALRETYEFWTELAKTGDSKINTMRKDSEQRFNYIYDYQGLCPCCEYSKKYEHPSASSVCFFCPIWDGNNTCGKEKGEYNRWAILKPHGKRKKYWAKTIANMAKENYNLLASLGYKEEGKD